MTTVEAAPEWMPDVEPELAAVMQAFADPSRLALVVVLDEATADEPDVCCFDAATLAGIGDLAKSTRSHHFRVLREAGVVSMRAEGTRKRVCLRREALDARFPGLLDAVLTGARTQS